MVNGVCPAAPDWTAHSMRSTASISSVFSAAIAAKKSTWWLWEEIFFLSLNVVCCSWSVLWMMLCGSRLLLWMTSECTRGTLRVPFTCLSLHDSLRHSPFFRDVGHIIGWNLSHLAPLVQPLGPLLPCVNSLRHAFGWSLGQPLPDIPWRQVPLR